MRHTRGCRRFTFAPHDKPLGKTPMDIDILLITRHQSAVWDEKKIPEVYSIFPEESVLDGC